MLSSDQIRTFHRDGFVVIPSVLSRGEVLRYRELMKQMFESSPDLSIGDDTNLRMNAISRYEALAELLFIDPVLRSLKSLLGEKFVISPNTMVVDSKYDGWHTDITTAALAGHTFSNDHAFSVVNAAFYFQDNGVYGGGLDVVPGSHKRDDIFLEDIRRKNEAYRNGSLLRSVKSHLRVFIPDFLLRLRRKFLAKNSLSLVQSAKPGQLTVAQNAGDLLIFDLRLWHKASWAKAPAPIPPDARKFAYFVICGANNETTYKYRDFLIQCSRTEPSYAYLINHKYPEWLCRKAREAGVTLL